MIMKSAWLHDMFSTPPVQACLKLGSALERAGGGGLMVASHFPSSHCNSLASTQCLTPLRWNSGEELGQVSGAGRCFSQIFFPREHFHGNSVEFHPWNQPPTTTTTVSLTWEFASHSVLKSPLLCSPEEPKVKAPVYSESCAQHPKGLSWGWSPALSDLQAEGPRGWSIN